MSPKDRQNREPANPTRDYYESLQTIAFQEPNAAATGSGNRSNKSRYERTKEVITLEWSASAVRIAYARTDKAVRIWKVGAAGEPVGKAPLIIDDCHERYIESISWDPTDDVMFATVGGDSFLKVWNANSGAEIKRLDLQVTDNFQVLFSGDAKLIAVASKSKAVHLVNYDKNKIAQTLKYDEHIYSICWSNDSSFLFVGLSNGQIDVYYNELQQDALEEIDFKLLTTLRGHRSSIKCLQMDPRGIHLFAGSNEGVLSIWNLSTFSCINTISTVDEPISNISITKDCECLAASYEDGESSKIFKVSNVSLVTEIPKSKSGKETFPLVKFSPVKNIYAYTTYEGEVLMATKYKN